MKNDEKILIQETDKNIFCSYCGTKLDIDAKFCKNCGKRTNQENLSKRNVIYEGNLHKCPNCGEMLKSFVSNCPSCGYEFRNTHSSNSIREFIIKLEQIEAKEMPEIEENESVMKQIFGKDLNEKDKEDEAREDFEEQKAKEKANLIINFSVPNTKEDILEFMILAASNIDTKKEIDDIVSEAWISKLEQVYQRAEITMKNNPDFVEIKKIYDTKKKQIKHKKIKGFLAVVSIFVGYAFLLGLLYNPIATIGIAIGISILLIIVFIFYKRKITKK